VPENKTAKKFGQRERRVEGRRLSRSIKRVCRRGWGGELKIISLRQKRKKKKSPGYIDRGGIRGTQGVKKNLTDSRFYVPGLGRGGILHLWGWKGSLFTQFPAEGEDASRRKIKPRITPRGGGHAGRGEEVKGTTGRLAQ